MLIEPQFAAAAVSNRCSNNLLGKREDIGEIKHVLTTARPTRNVYAANVDV
jgi:hypothetical protein